MVDMFEYKGDSLLRIVSDPRLFEDDDKRAAAEEGRTYVCRCAAGKDLRYRFAKDLRFYPVRKGDIASEHAESCVFSDKYEDYIRKRKGVIRDSATGTLRSPILENIRKPLTAVEIDSSSSSSSKSEGGSERGTRILTLIKNLNLEISERQAFASKKKVRDAYAYSRWIYMRAKEVPVEGRDMMLNEPDSSARFFYGIFKDIKVCYKDKDEEKEVSLSLYDYDIKKFISVVGAAYKIRLITTYIDKEGKEKSRFSYVTLTALRSGLKAYIREHGGEDVCLKNDFGRIAAIGFDYDIVYKDKMGVGKSTKKIGRLWFMDITKYGAYAKTKAEAIMQECSFSFMASMDGVRFYISSGGEYPYGVISLDRCPYKTIIKIKGEHGGSGSDGDKEIKWDPSDGADDLRERINGILKDMKADIS